MTDPGLTKTESDAGGESDLAVLVRAHGLLRALVVQLETAPFADATAASMHAYLDEEATRASSAFARWLGLPEQSRTGQDDQALRGRS